MTLCLPQFKWTILNSTKTLVEFLFSISSIGNTKWYCIFLDINQVQKVTFHSFINTCNITLRVLHQALSLVRQHHGNSFKNLNFPKLNRLKVLCPVNVNKTCNCLYNLWSNHLPCNLVYSLSQVNIYGKDCLFKGQFNCQEFKFPYLIIWIKIIFIPIETNKIVKEIIQSLDIVISIFKSQCFLLKVFYFFTLLNMIPLN